MLHDVRKQGIQGYKIECVTIAPICTDLMDLSGRISFQCCALLVYHCAFFRYVSPKKIRNSLRAASSSKCLLALLCIFVFYLFLHLIILSFFSSLFFCFSFSKRSCFFAPRTGNSQVNLFKDVSKGWFHIVQCQTVLLLLQSASYLLCHDRVFFGKFPTRACCYVTTTRESVLHRPISLSLHQQSCDSHCCHYLLISDSFSLSKYQKKSEKCSSQFPRSQSQIASFVQKESKKTQRTLHLMTSKTKKSAESSHLTSKCF